MQSLILSNFTLRNVIVIIIVIIIIINVIVVVDFVRLQFPSREALTIEPKPLPVSGRAWRRLRTRSVSLRQDFFPILTRELWGGDAGRGGMTSRGEGESI